MSRLDTETKPSKKQLTYPEVVAKCQKLLAMMRANDREAGKMMNPPQPSAESEFLEQSALALWGYRRTPASLAVPNTHLAIALKSFGIGSCGGKKEVNSYKVHDEHFISTVRDGVCYPSSAAVFRSTIDRNNGILTANANYGPRDSLGDDYAPGVLLPKLQHWSDIAYLHWNSPESKPRDSERDSELKYVMRFQIANHDTLLIVRHIMDEYRRAQQKPAS
jgi:hypothetical protein